MARIGRADTGGEDARSEGKQSAESRLSVLDVDVACVEDVSLLWVTWKTTGSLTLTLIVYFTSTTEP